MTRQADRGVASVMEGHAEMDMNITQGAVFQILASNRERVAS